MYRPELQLRAVFLYAWHVCTVILKISLERRGQGTNGHTVCLLLDITFSHAVSRGGGSFSEIESFASVRHDAGSGGQ